MGLNEGEALPQDEPKKRGRKPGQRRRTNLEIARDRYEIEKLRLRYRLPYWKISEKINEFYADEPEETVAEDGKIILRPNVSPEQVKKELALATEDYIAESNDIIIEKRREIIREFRDLATQCQERYDASIVDKVTNVTEERINDEKGATTTTRETRVNTDGNANYLNIKAFALKFVAELEAVIPPKKIAPTNPEGTEAYKFEGADEMKRLAVLAQEAGLILGTPREEVK